MSKGSRHSFYQPGQITFTKSKIQNKDYQNLNSPDSTIYVFLWIGWIPGLEIDITFFSERFFYLKKVELTQWIVPIPGIPNFWSNSLGIRFWDFCSIFEIAWVAPICVGVVISKLSNALNFLCWSFSYIKLRVFIRFHVNPRNFYPRKIHFLAGFSVETI